MRFDNVMANHNGVSGSMTCAGITGLAICQAALSDLELKRYKLQNDIAAARVEADAP